MFEPDPISGPVPRAAPPATGLGQYQVVPDDYAGPIKPGQIKQSDHDELVKYGFGKLNVLDPAAAQKLGGKLGNDQMTQEQFDKLAKSWLAMSQGNGMKLSGDGKDIDAFKRMMSGAMADSPTMRNLLTEIGGETDATRAFDVKLGHNQPSVLIDSLPSKRLDLDDMAALPSAHDAQLPRNSITREDQIVHILAERRSAAKVEGAARDAKRPPPSDEQIFDIAHPSGLRAQNDYRAERGQVAVKSSATDRVANTDTTISRYEMDDGTEEYIRAIHGGTIDKIIPPGPRRRP